VGDDGGAGFLRLSEGFDSRTVFGQFRRVEVDEEVGEIHAAHDLANRRHDNVVDHGGDDFAEGHSNNHAHGEVHNVALEGELFEFLYYAHNFVWRFCTSC